MTGILIVAHGSRQRPAEETFDGIYKQVSSLLPGLLIETAYMEFNERNIRYGLDLLVRKGADDIKVIPYFLFPGTHIKEDIPNEIESYLSGHKAVKITMGKTLGDDYRLAEILKDRIEECL